MQNDCVLIASAITKAIILYPLESLKTWLSLSQAEFKDVFDSLFFVGGPQSIYSGLLPSLIPPLLASTIGTATVPLVKHQLLPSDPSKAIRRHSAQQYTRKSPIPELIRKTPRVPDKYQTPIEVISYGVSGAVVAAMSCPFSVVQLALQVNPGSYINAYDATTSLIQTAGWGVFFSGYVPYVVHGFIHRAVLSAVFISLKQYFAWLRTKSEKNLSRTFKEYMKRLGLSRFRTVDILVSLFISGMFAACVSSPLFVLTTTYQAKVITSFYSTSSSATTIINTLSSAGGRGVGQWVLGDVHLLKLTISETLALILKSYGTSGFFAGLLPNAVHSGLSGVLSFLLAKYWTHLLQESSKRKKEEEDGAETVRDVIDRLCRRLKNFCRGNRN